MKLAAFVLVALVAVSAAAPWLAPHDPARQFREHAAEGPSARFWLGTDEFGRDNWSRLLHAGRWSILVALLASSLSLVAGLAMGLLAAGAGNWVDEAILWLGDLTLSLPWLYLLFALRGLMPLSLEPEIALAAMVALVGLIGWATPARLVRAAAQSVFRADYVTASRSFGASRLHIWRHHILPTLGSVLAPQVLVLVPRYVLAESALSFLGLGLSEPTPTWGSLLASARQSMATGLQWWNLAPVAPLVALTLACSQLAEKEAE